MTQIDALPLERFRRAIRDAITLDETISQMRERADTLLADLDTLNAQAYAIIETIGFAFLRKDDGNFASGSHEKTPEASMIHSYLQVNKQYAELRGSLDQLIDVFLQSGRQHDAQLI